MYMNQETLDRLDREFRDQIRATTKTAEIKTAAVKEMERNAEIWEEYNRLQAELDKKEEEKKAKQREIQRQKDLEEYERQREEHKKKIEMRGIINKQELSYRKETETLKAQREQLLKNTEQYSREYVLKQHVKLLYIEHVKMHKYYKTTYNKRALYKTCYYNTLYMLDFYKFKEDIQAEKREERKRARAESERMMKAEAEERQFANAMFDVLIKLQGGRNNNTTEDIQTELRKHAKKIIK